ncbi:hypothetical protein NSMM_260100 [Nitrosomonas mobilis]|uniref:Uncharacterized protein n=1 Tax=Nitrosomonas mobilis TaxID=51642 RepID=A0A1G5SC86_9PROT|nr:hypothetical protein NSMM_260100 [Nitrosomonas mobilis]
MGVKLDGPVEIADAQHGVQDAHFLFL